MEEEAASSDSSAAGENGAASPNDWVRDNKTGDLKWVDTAKDQATSPTGTTYVGETAKEGDLTYAADGKVYDDSAKGGGQETYATKSIEEVVIEKVSPLRSLADGMEK